MSSTFKPEKAVVIGTGTMGIQIACMLANLDINVLLLEKAGDGQNDSTLLERADNRLKEAVKKVPPWLYENSVSDKITTGLLNEHLQEISSAKWVIESISEDLEKKVALFKYIEEFINSNAHISTNTSSILINDICNSFDQNFRERFFGLHFFNPVRYIPVIEIIPGKDTSGDIIDSTGQFLDKMMGKHPVCCPDTPGFIANRIGIYNFLITLQATLDLGYRVEEVDKLTGRILGRPKYGIFRAADAIGIDIMLKVINHIRKNTPDEYFKEVEDAIGVLESMAGKNLLGRKTGGGFYKKEKMSINRDRRLVINPDRLVYRKLSRVKLKVISKARKYRKLSDRYAYLLSHSGPEGNFYRMVLLGPFDYVSNLIPGLTSEIYKIDDILKLIYGWETGLFELWQQMGIPELSLLLKKYSFNTPAWIDRLIENNIGSFFSVVKDRQQYYDSIKKDFIQVPGVDGTMFLDNIRSTHTVWKNDGASLLDLGDGILNLEFHTKMNIINTDVAEAIHKGLDLAGKDFSALVIGNEGNHFSVGVNLGMLFMMAIEKDYAKIDEMIRMFQNIVLDIKYAPVPIIAAPHGLTFGGGMEISLHCDRIHATTETYMGLVEIKAGLLPAGGGTKEFTSKLAQVLEGKDADKAALHLLDTIIFGKASNNAHEARKFKLMEPDDPITPNPRRLIHDAKNTALKLVRDGYQAPSKDRMIETGGNRILDLFTDHIDSLHGKAELSSYDVFIAKKVAGIMSGGDKGRSGSQVSEQYLLDLEKDAFLSLMGRRKTIDRIYRIIGRK